MAEENKLESTQAKAGADAVPADAGPIDSAGEAAKPAPKPVKMLKHVSFAVAHVRASFNNTMVAISDAKGGVLAWSSCGRAGFKGSRKSTAYAAGVVGQEVARQAIGLGVKEVEVRVQGPGAGRETAIRALQTSGLNISVIKDVTPMPHNGCRPRKRRRV
ncbi:MAG: 30S ribosomal protein S11 [bacterium]